MEINIIPKFLDAALTPIGKEVGERLSDIVSLVFTPIIKAKAVRDNNIKAFLDDLNEKISEIPEEELKDPPLSIVGQTLEDVGKYYHEEEHLRKLFAKLIASSMDQRRYVHPSYIKIIEELSSYDAKFITELIIQSSNFNYSKNNEYLSKEMILLWYTSTNNWQDAIECWEFIEGHLKKRINSNPELIHIKNTLINLNRLGIIDMKKSDIEFGLPMESIFEDLNDEILSKDIFDYKSYSIRMTKFGLYFANSCC